MTPPANGTYSFPSKTDLSFIFQAESGTPYDFVYSGDMNGDGSANNDLIYVPTDARLASEITFATNGTGASAITPAPAPHSRLAAAGTTTCLPS